MDRWVGKTAVVTGASGGIGACLTVKLAQAGVNVFGLARRPEKVDELKKEVKAGKGKIISIKCDVSKPDEITRAFDHIKAKMGTVHILINNAGIIRTGAMADTNFEDVKAILDTNVTGLIVCSKEAIKLMDESNVSGHIVNINSIAGHKIMSSVQLSAYSPSKWAVTASTGILRDQLAERKSVNKIKVTSISPGLVKTNIFDASAMAGGLYENAVHLSSEDVVDAIMYVLGTPPNVDITELTIRPVGELF